MCVSENYVTDGTPYNSILGSRGQGREKDIGKEGEGGREFGGVKERDIGVRQQRD